MDVNERTPCKWSHVFGLNDELNLVLGRRHSLTGC